MPNATVLVIGLAAAGLFYGGKATVHGVKVAVVKTAQVVSHPFRHPKKDAKAVGHAVTHPKALEK